MAARPGALDEVLAQRAALECTSAELLRSLQKARTDASACDVFLYENCAHEWAPDRELREHRTTYTCSSCGLSR